MNNQPEVLKSSQEENATFDWMMTDMRFLRISEGRSNSSSFASTTSERDAHAPVQIMGHNWDKLERGQRPYHTHTHTTEWYDPFELLKSPANPRNWSRIPVSSLSNPGQFSQNIIQSCNYNISTQFIYGCMAAYLKRPTFVPEEGNSLLWSIETLSVPWIVVVHTNSFSNGL